jgi:hypothetical protein
MGRPEGDEDATRAGEGEGEGRRAGRAKIMVEAVINGLPSTPNRLGSKADLEPSISAPNRDDRVTTPSVHPSTRPRPSPVSFFGSSYTYPLGRPAGS